MGSVHEIHAHHGAATEIIASPDLAALHSAEAYQLPLILTPEYVARLGQMNRVSRQLRALGYQMMFEDAMPTDRPTPLVQVRLGRVGPRPIQNLAGGGIDYPGRGLGQAHVDGVCVQWRSEQ